MEVFSNIWVFFASAIFISLTGVMTPGQLFATAIAKGYKDEKAGIKIAIGHGLVEFPLMALIVVSLDYIFENDLVKLGIGLVGGVLLLFLGLSMIKSRKLIADDEHEYIPYNWVVAGALTTFSNPYFLLWWATVGAVLVLNAEFFGPMIVVVSHTLGSVLQGGRSRRSLASMVARKKDEQGTHKLRGCYQERD